MPPQNAVELVPTKSGDETSKNGNFNNNNKDTPTKFDLRKVEEVPEPTKATIVIPPDGGFGWIVMVSLKDLCSLIFSDHPFHLRLQVSVATLSLMVLFSVPVCSSIPSKTI